MASHLFIFQPGIWLGEGFLTVSGSSEKTRFYTKWIVNEADANKEIYCKQSVEVQGADEKTINYFLFSLQDPASFHINLENDMLGKATGTGLIDPFTIAWEYRGNPEFEGFEAYKLDDNGEYVLHAEYVSTEIYRTVINGRIWRKSV